MLSIAYLFLLYPILQAQNSNLFSVTLECFQYYEIQPNDVCFDISSRFGVTIGMLLEWNSNLDCDLLIPTQTICAKAYPRYDGSDSTPSPFIDPSLCVMQWIISTNDTCAKIIDVTGISMKRLLEINRQSVLGFDCANLRIGSRVCLGSEIGPSSHSLSLDRFDKREETVIHKYRKYYYKKPTKGQHVTYLSPKGYKLKSKSKKTQQPKPKPKPNPKPKPKQSIQEKPKTNPKAISNPKPRPKSDPPKPQVVPVVPSHSLNDDGSLAETNKERAAVGVGPMAWDEALAKQAGDYSDYLSSQGCILKHSGFSGQGENLYAIYGSQSASMTNAIKAWVEEKWHTSSGQLNHWTQVAWKGTQKMGCAKSTNHATNCVVVTCRYWPAGNVVGQPPY